MVKELSQEVFDLINPTCSVRPRLYDLPKLHKEGTPLRPILYMIKFPQHGLAKYLNGLLEPVLQGYLRYTVKDYFTFANEIKDINAKDTYMTFFDIKHLFTNVPLKEVIRICVDRLYSSNKLTLKKENFIQLMQVATEQVEFGFKKLLHRQIDGIAMG